MKKIILTSICVLYSLFSFAQEQGSISIDWITKKEFSFGNYSFKIPQFSSESFNFNSHQKSLNFTLKVTLTNSVNPTTNGITPGSGPFDTSWNSSPGYASNKKWWGDVIPPFRYSGGNFAGLNWGPSTGTPWVTPDPTSGTANWLEPSEFAAAVDAAPQP